MTREEIHKLGIHKLVAGYATGTLTEAERQALFAAALDDQELFDELAREQELKELLEEPGVRQRLLLAVGSASLEPAARKQAWWEKRRWTWAAAATVAAVVLGVYLVQPPEPKRLAVVLPQAPRMTVPPVPFLPPPPEDRTAPPLPAPAAVERARQGVTPRLPQPLPPAGADAPKAVDQISENKPEAAPKREAVAQAPAPPPAPTTSRAAVAPIPPQGLIAGGRGGGGGGGAVSVNGLLQKGLGDFGFTYSVTAEGRLRIVPSGSGFLSMSAAGQVQVSNRALAAGSTTEFLVPVGATSATVVFSAQPIADSIVNIVKNPLDAPAGTVSDPNPTPASRLELVIPVEPR